MLLEVLQFFTGVFVVVYDGQHALRYTLGRAKEVVGPGVHFKWPIVQKFRVEETKHTTLDLEPQVIQLKDDLVYEVDAKVMYQIVDLRKSLIEVDELVSGMQNRVVLAIQRVVQLQDRHTIRDTRAMEAAIHRELASMEDQWGIKILLIGFSNISPSPATLEITQLDLLARERLQLYEQLRSSGLEPGASVALVTGAVVTADAGGTAEPDGGRRWARATEQAIAAQERELESHAKRKARQEQGEEPGEESDESAGEDDAGDEDDET